LKLDFALLQILNYAFQERKIPSAARAHPHQAKPWLMRRTEPKARPCPTGGADLRSKSSADGRESLVGFKTT